MMDHTHKEAIFKAFTYERKAVNRRDLALVVGFFTRLSILGALTVLPLLLGFVPLALSWYLLTWTFYIVSYTQEGDHPSRYQKFSKHTPFFRYGRLVAEQNFYFQSLRKHEGTEELETRVHRLVEKVARGVPRVTSRLTEPQTRSVTIVDTGLWTKSYAKTFVEYSTETYFNTRVSVIFGVTAVNDKVYVRWWVLMRGHIRWLKAIGGGLVAPFTVLYWGLKKLQGLYSIKAALSSDIEHDYDVLDVESWVGIFQTHFFNDLIQKMEKSGFDVESYKKQAINFDQRIMVSDYSAIHLGTPVTGNAHVGTIEGSHRIIEQVDEDTHHPSTSPFVVDSTTPVPSSLFNDHDTVDPLEDTRQTSERKRVSSFDEAMTTPTVASLFKDHDTVDPLEDTRQTSERKRVEAFGEAMTTPTVASLFKDHDTVEVPAVHFDLDPTMETEKLSPVHELQQMLQYHVESKRGEARHEAETVVNELVVELETGDEISIKILTALLGELRMAMGDTALRDALEMLTDPTGGFNEIVQEITGDMLANLGDELTLKARKQELHEELAAYAHKLDLRKVSQARIAIYSLMRALDNPEPQYNEGLFKDIYQRLGREAYEFVLYMFEAEENHFQTSIRSQAKRELAIHLKKQDLREALMARIGNIDPAKKQKATQAINELIASLENPQIKSYKLLFREIGIRVGRTGYESMLRRLATNDNYFPVAQSEAKRDLNIYERAQQRQVN